MGEGAGYKLARIGAIINKKTRELSQKKVKGRKKKKKIKKQILRLRKRMLKLQTELHNKTSNLLTKIGRVICLPDFGVKKMVRRGSKRKISRKVVRAMMALGHYKNKEQMKTKSVQNNCKILHTKEPYTTQQCGCCGKINNVGSNKTYECKRCNLKIARDDTSARNNLMCNIRHFRS
jgi:putative transposase